MLTRTAIAPECQMQAIFHDRLWTLGRQHLKISRKWFADHNKQEAEQTGMKPQRQKNQQKRQGAKSKRPNYNVCVYVRSDAFLQDQLQVICLAVEIIVLS